MNSTIAELLPNYWRTLDPKAYPPLYFPDPTRN